MSPVGLVMSLPKLAAGVVLPGGDVRGEAQEMTLFPTYTIVLRHQ